jgi:two-component system, cell cycle sensor histidine kinase and response regulator CckA
MLDSPQAPSLDPTTRARGTETLLVVEDEQPLRELVRETLEDEGYAVLTAQGAEEAFRLSRGHEGPIHLLLTDVVLPGTSGPDLARGLAAERPGTKVLFASGYGDDAVLRHGLATDEAPFIQKPFSPDILLRKIRQILDGVSGPPAR